MRIDVLKNKRFLLPLAVLLVAAVVFLVFGPKAAAPVEYGKELLANADFEVLDSDTLPDAWYTDAYLTYSDITVYRSAEGRQGLGGHIINHAPNDARFAQAVKVLPNTTYRFSGYIKAAAEGGRGANLSIADVYVFSEAVYDTQGDWQYVEIFGKTGAKQTEVIVFARLGGYSGEASGEAFFDKLSLTAVEDVPEGKLISSWEKPADVPQAEAGTPSAQKPLAPWLVLINLAFTMILLKLARYAAQHEDEPLDSRQNLHTNLMLAGILVFAFVSRVLLALYADGFPVDINAFRVWSDNMVQAGPGKFYLLDGHRDYPPGYMLVLWAVGAFSRALGYGVTELMIKMPSIVCDILIILLLFKAASKSLGGKSSLALAALYAFNPLTYLAGAAWGQVDSLPSLLLLISVLFIRQKRWRYALPAYVLAVLMKPQALMVGPLGLLAFIAQFIWAKDRAERKTAARDALFGVLGAVALAVAVVLPFFNEQNGISWLFGLYGNTMSYYHYATVNATNLYFLSNLNWVDVQQASHFMVRLMGSLTLLVPSAIFAWKSKSQKPTALPNNSEKPLPRFAPLLAALPALAALLPFTLAVTGSLMMLSVFLQVALMYWKVRSADNLALLAGILLLGFSVLGTMMHERYLFLSMALLTLAYIQRRDSRVLLLLLMVSSLCFLNTGVALDRGVRIGGSSGNLHAPAAGLISDSAWLEYLLSAWSLLMTGYAIHLGHALMASPGMVKALGAQKEDKPAQPALLRLLIQKAEKVRFDKKDALLILLVTVLYAVVALVNLGSTTSPQTPWVSGPGNPEATLDLGSEQEFRLLFFGGIHWSDSDFTVSVSPDGETFTPYDFNIKQGDLFTWRFLGHPYTQNDKIFYDSNPRVLQGRYVRISGMSNRLTLMEVIAQDANTGDNLPFVSSSAGAEALMDEQDAFSGLPSWHNSMYFDEIYHARTAYEQRNGLLGLEPSQVYETSHPPLGKLLMTFSVMLFGMTPFGWRFAGAMAGVLMLPGLYLLGKQLTRRRSLGLLAMLFMAFDFMHFAQTRIATIDSFVTLFIIYAYFFMFRYMMLDHVREPFRKKMLPLFLSGLMMGLAIASKWPGIYAGAGLAVLFFITQARNIGTGLACQKAMAKEGNAEKDALAATYANQWFKDLVLTCLWCLLFFVAIPLVIYYLSYIPVYIATPGGLTIQKVINNNINMFDYHSVPGRGADHFYSSPWYSWPIIGKPMYFYAGGIRNGTSSVIWSFGNPLVWWGGLLGIILVSAWAILQRVFQSGKFSDDKPGFWATLARDGRPALLVISFLAQFLPWVMVPRGTYIYHYFPSVPFIILCVVLLLDILYRKHPKLALALVITLSILAGLLFIAFFPYISGVRVSTTWLDAVRRLFPGPLYY